MPPERPTATYLPVDYIICHLDADSSPRTLLRHEAKELGKRIITAHRRIVIQPHKTPDSCLEMQRLPEGHHPSVPEDAPGSCRGSVTDNRLY